MRDIIIKIVSDFLINLGQWLKTLIQAPVVPPTVIHADFFADAVAYLLPNEGGYVNDPSDHGGATNFGITQSTLLRWRLRADPQAKVTSDDVKNMKVDEAKEIYKQWYWADYHLDRVRVKPIAIALLDQDVLNGQKTAIMLAQKACNACGEDLLADGVIGPLTLEAFDKLKVNAFLNAFHCQVMARYDAIVKGDSTQQRFYGGWSKRADRLLTLATVS